MNRIRVWTGVTMLMVCTALVFAQEQANEIRCSGGGTTCKSGFIPKYASNGGSATVNDSILSQSGTTVTAAGNLTATGNVTGAFVEGNASTGTAVEGTTADALPAVFGWNRSTSAPLGAFGVEGYAPGPNGVGVAASSNRFGQISSSIFGTASIGVIGDSASGYAIVAASDSSNALLAANGSTNDTVVISNQGNGPPLFATGTLGSLFLDGAGNLSVSGAITAGTKDFKIDHPLDPGNKYLYHASVESSEMMNIYTGTVRMDLSGSAMVTLPDWFEAVNADFRYQVTAIGAPAPNLHIAREISNNQFVIAGGQPGMKVSWQITGVRHDAYAKAHPLEVSVDKPEQERGYYIHPELYSESVEKSLSSLHLAQVKQRASRKD